MRVRVRLGLDVVLMGFAFVAERGGVRVEGAERAGDAGMIEPQMLEPIGQRRGVGRFIC